MCCSLFVCLLFVFVGCYWVFVDCCVLFFVSWFWFVVCVVCCLFVVCDGFGVSCLSIVFMRIYWYCLLFVISWLVFVVRCVLCVVRFVLRVGCWFVAGCSFPVAWFVLFLAWLMVFVVFYGCVVYYVFFVLCSL